MKKNFKLGLFCLSLLLLTGCNSGKKTEDNTTTKTGLDAVDLPTEIPSIEGDSLQIHYKRSNHNYENWNLWLWARGKDGARYDFNYKDTYGVIASYALSEFPPTVKKDGLGFIVRKSTEANDWSAKDVTSDRFIDFSALEKDDNNVYHVYLKQKEACMFVDATGRKLNSLTADFKTTTKIDLVSANSMKKVEVSKNGSVIKEENISSVTTTYTVTLPSSTFSFTDQYRVKATFVDDTFLEVAPKISKLYDTDMFEDTYNYEGPLGVDYSAAASTFRVWSPVSSKITLKVYNNGTPVATDANKGSDAVLHSVDMTAGEKGVYETTINENLDGKYYTYVVYNNEHPEGFEVVDPYAKACGVNGLRGMIVDFDTTDPDGWNDVEVLDIDRKNLAVYETHIADVTSSDTWGGTATNAKKFAGMIEKGTTLPADNTIKTGFDHIIDLGVNAVQLLPIFDAANDEVNVEFNWGYNPLNYNCLDGSFSLDPYNGKTRITEFKQLVQAYNAEGINIIMDVVYNHVAGANGSNFDALMPGYYFRYTAAGDLSNGSGCGNETACDRFMFNKFMIDSTEFWASEYKLAGFRFDLMGLHTIDTMNEVVANLKTKVNDNIVVYGEPWTGGGTTLSNDQQAVQNNGSKFVNYGQFNDQMRDALISGGLNPAESKAWIANTSFSSMACAQEAIYGMKGWTGNIIKSADKTVNYVTCHDNYTLQDRLRAAGITDTATIKKMAMLAQSIVLTSQGTTFMLAGEEMFRTKGGNSNSYNASYEVNALDYSQLLDADVAAMYENYKKLVALKTENNSPLALSNSEISSKWSGSLVEGENSQVIKVKINHNGKTYLIYHCSGVDATHTINNDLSNYNVYLDTLGELSGKLSSTVTLKPYQTLIAVL